MDDAELKIHNFILINEDYFFTQIDEEAFNLIDKDRRGSIDKA